MKDLIIGGASGYTWTQLKNWVRSIKATNFDGDIGIVITDVTKDTIDKLNEEGVKIFAYGKQNASGGFDSQSRGAPHVERFFYIWNAINKLSEYDHLIVTDTRDVIFQENPKEYLKKSSSILNDRLIICSSEGLKYKDEPWGNNNLLEAFGPYFHDIHKDNMIYNVGTIAGEYETVCDILLLIFQMSINRPIPIVDQAVFNFLISYEPFISKTIKTDSVDAWAAQLGTTIHAVESGVGDLGMMIKNNPTQMIKYQMMYNDDQPTIDDNGFVYNKSGVKFTIVHQYDRVAGLKDKIDRRYA